MTGPPPFGPIVGDSLAIRRVRELIERYAPTALPILIVGATGTGKELIARHVHDRSARRGDFVDVNCGALPREMVESLLFGHRRGAFTGAVESTVGHVERAHTGTLFLDEVLHLPPEGQVKLLRALETGEVQRLGEGTKRQVSVRAVAAAQEDAGERVTSGAFRRDLFQRLAGVVIELPSLDDRPEDIEPLAVHFAARQKQTLEPGTIQVLVDHPWFGNVRELRLVIERAAGLVENGSLPPGAVREAIALGCASASTRGDCRRAPARGFTTLASALAHTEANLIRAALHAEGGNRERAASRLGVSSATLYRRLSELRVRESLDSHN